MDKSFIKVSLYDKPTAAPQELSMGKLIKKGRIDKIIYSMNFLQGLISLTKV